MKTDRIVRILLFFLFAAFIAVPSILMFANLREAGLSAENRSAAGIPSLPPNFRSFPRYAAVFEAFYNNSFGLRRALIRWNNLLRLRLFGESPMADVRVGRDGWLYYEGEWSLLDYENVMPYSKKDLDEMAENMEERRAWLAARGIGFFITVAPNTQTIYPEHLPPGIGKIGKESRYDQIARKLEENPALEFIDLRGPLREAKTQQRLYHRTDSHWNEYGAFIGYREIIQRIAERYPNVRRLSDADYTVSSVQGKGGDLAELLSLTDVIGEERIVLTPKFTPKASRAARDYPNPVHLPGRDMVVMETGDKSLPKALVFRDSYSTALIPYLSESFRSVVCIWTFDFLPEIIEREKPDIVILECVERYLNAMQLGNPKEVKAAATARGSLPGRGLP